MDGIAASSHVTNTAPGLVMEDTVALEQIKHMVRDADVTCHLATSAKSLLRVVSMCPVLRMLAIVPSAVSRPTQAPCRRHRPSGESCGGWRRACSSAGATPAA